MSYNIGLSGLRTTNQTLEVISQNIANASTAGFKAGRAELAALYSSGQASGVEMQRVSQNFNKDGIREFTGRDLDMAISGNGFFMLKDGNGLMRYTRAGMFDKDADGYIVAPGGLRLQGYAADANGSLNTGVVTDLRIPTGNLAAQTSTTLEFTANFKADASVPADPVFHPTNPDSFNFSYSSAIYDTQGIEHTLTQYMRKTGDNTWQAFYYLDGAPLGPNEVNTYTAANTTSPSDAVTVEHNNQSVDAGVITFQFDAYGKLIGPAAITDANGSVLHEAGLINLTFTPSGGTAPMSISMFNGDSTQYAGDFSVARNVTDGYPSGELAGLRVDEDGTLSAVYTNGRERVQGKVVLATFSNPNGLAQADGTTWTQTFASGSALVGEPGSGALGLLTPGAYEGSNVDLTSELVSLMTAQRNYQANAKSLSSTDKMTQVLFNTF